MVSLAVTLILAGVIEIGLRAAEWKNPKHKNPWPPKQIETAPRLAPAYFYNPTGRGDYTADIDSVVVEFKYAPLHFRTNNEGFLGSWEFDEKKKTILTIGASLTYGAYINSEDNYPSWLQSLIRRHFNGASPFQVMNAARPGYIWEDAVDYLNEKGNRLNLSAVLLQGGISDAANCLQENKEASSRVFSRRKLKESLPPTELPSSPVNRLRMFLGNYSAFYNLLSDWKSAVAQRKAEDKIKAVVADGGPEADQARAETNNQASRRIAYEPDAAESQAGWKCLSGKLSELATHIRSLGAVPVMVVFPDKPQINNPSFPTTPQRKYAELLKATGFTMVDTLPYMRPIGASEPIWLRRYPLMAGDYKEKTTRIDVPEVYTETQAGIGHLSRFGYYLVAKAVLETLLREKLLNES